jgi:hypothetical protein
MKHWLQLTIIGLLALAPRSARSAEPLQVSGIYPHLAMFNEEGECGTGGAAAGLPARLGG